MPGKRDAAFAIIGVCFSALLLVLSLLTAVRLSAAGDRADALERACRQLQTENAALAARLESSLSLEEIERCAVEVYGMQPGSTAQKVYLEYPAE